MDFTGKLLHGGQLVDQVAGWIDEITRGRVEAWFGSLEAPGVSDPVSLIDQSIFRLELDDGRAGDIVITAARFGPGMVVIAEFQGSGPLA